MFTNKVVLVTGAASGIGRDTVIGYCEKNANVVASDVDSDGLNETVKLAKKHGGKAVAAEADISDPEAVKKLIEHVIQIFGRLDIACNNAGISGVMTATADYDLEEWNRVVNINLRGQWLCMKYQIPAMLETGGGSIVNVSSILGSVGFANAPAYVAAKHGLEGLTRTAALEYSSQGIRVNTVAPAFIETPMLEKAGITTDKAMKQSLVDLHPIGRMGRPREVADAIIWISSDEASFVTGHTMLVDGGYTAR